MLSDNQRTLSPLTGFDDSLQYQVANLQGLGRRQRQEDSFTLANALSREQYLKSGLMICVCDGMGGMKDGKVASETAIASLRRTFSALDLSGNIGRQLGNGLYAASDEVLSILGGGGGSTAVFCVFYQDKLYFSSTGDSFLYLYRGGRLIKLNVEHNLCNQRYLENIRDGELDINGPREDAEAQALTSFLGMDGELTVDYSAHPIPLRRGDIVLACSDGVGGVLGEGALLTMLEGGNVQEIAKDIDEAIQTIQKPNQDNYTALLVSCY